MTIIVDAQISPHLAKWIQDNFNINAYSVSYLGLAKAEDTEIFNEARRQNAILITKDNDFIHLLHQFGSPPKIIWITCGNTSNLKMKEILIKNLEKALHILENEDLVEVK